jgi:hypothetical protein
LPNDEAVESCIVVNIDNAMSPRCEASLDQKVVLSEVHIVKCVCGREACSVGVACGIRAAGGIRRNCRVRGICRIEGGICAVGAGSKSDIVVDEELPTDGWNC